MESLRKERSQQHTKECIGEDIEAHRGSRFQIVERQLQGMFKNTLPSNFRTPSGKGASHHSQEEITALGRFRQFLQER